MGKKSLQNVQQVLVLHHSARQHSHRCHRKAMSVESKASFDTLVESSKPAKNEGDIRHSRLSDRAILHHIKEYPID